MARPQSSEICAGWDNSECTGTPYCPPRCPKFLDARGDPIVIRLFREENEPSLLDMYTNLDPDQRTMGLPPVTPQEIERWVGSLIETGWNLVALRGNRIVGHVGVAPAKASDPQFVVFVDDAFQHRGIGTELITQLLAYAADRCYEGLSLSVSPDNPLAITLYRKLGFENDDGDFAPDSGASHIEMELRLPHPVAERAQLPPADR